MTSEESKRYIHHYNFPSYSVGETKPSRGPGRREIGHGALAERALVPVIPSVEEFPYAIRLVSEVLSSNGSTSQASICGSTLALMDAGVPIKAPVAGISCGLITEGDRWMTMVDIQGIEDFFGDMDFKVGGTKKGITAIQMDLKIHGLTPDMVKEALEKTHKARNYIIDEIILKAIPEVAASAVQVRPQDAVHPDPRGQDPGGHRHRRQGDPEDLRRVRGEDGRGRGRPCVHLRPGSGEVPPRHWTLWTPLSTIPSPAPIYNGRVTRLMDFGAFVEIAPGKEGLVHISRLDVKRTDKVTDVVNVGDDGEGEGAGDRRQGPVEPEPPGRFDRPGRRCAGERHLRKPPAPSGAWGPEP